MESDEFLNFMNGILGQTLKKNISRLKKSGEKIFRNRKPALGSRG